jgi:hypothetical protein
MSSNVTYLLLWVIIPIIPAFVLFKFLKDAGGVRGTGKAAGFNWQLKGAFGGYAFIFLSLAAPIYKAITPPDEDWKTIRVEGTLQVGGSIDPRSVSIVYRPPSAEINEVNGKFGLAVRVPKNSRPGDPSPYLLVGADRHKPVSVPLFDIPETAGGYQTSEFNIKKSADGNLLTISTPIEIRPNDQPLVQ